MRRVPLGAVLIASMMSSTAMVFGLAVLASPIIADLGIFKWQIGVLGAVNTGLGALSAPWSGRVTDRIGPRRSVLGCIALSAATLVLVGVSNGYWMLMFAFMLGGIPQGWGNPACNTLIGAATEPGQRGTMTGIKQSGVTLAVFTTGLALPTLETHLEWRGAFMVFAALFAVVLVLAAVVLPSELDRHHTPSRSQRNAPVSPYVNQLALFGFLMGLSGGGVGRFLPLFAEEALGYSVAVAGLAAAGTGLLGMAFRIAAASAAEHRTTPTRLMALIGVIGALCSLVMAITPTIGPWMLWPVVVLFAAGHLAWNSVINLAVIIDAGPGAAGKASGKVALGFLMGITVSSPVAGALIDATGRYWPAWLASAVIALGAVAVLARPTPEPVRSEAG